MAGRENEPDPVMAGGGLPADGVSVTNAAVGDAEEILALQKLAFRSEAEYYNDFTLPPMLQSLEDMREDFTRQIVVKAVQDGRIIGSARGYVKDGTGHVNRVIVHPDMQGRGIGALVMNAMEARLSGAVRFELFTGLKRSRTVRFYERLGYSIFKTVPGRIELVYMEKTAPGT